jgi:putative DNA primase/helicase
MNITDQIKAAAATAGLSPSCNENHTKPATDSGPGVSPPSKDHRAFLEYTPPCKQDALHVWDYPKSDDGSAACFLEHYGSIVRYCPELDRWRVWHGHRWHDDTTGRMGHYLQLLSRAEILAVEELLKMAKDEDDVKRAKAMRSRAEKLGNETTIHSTLAAAARNPKVIVPLGQWDANPWLVGVENGVIDLKTLQLLPGRPTDFLTRALRVRFDSDAICTRFAQFIARVLPGDLGPYVQQLAGYSLTGNVDDGAFYFCHGSGKNGKSILLETFAYIYGDYAGHARAELIEEPRHGGSAKHDLASLPGVRFLHSEETTDGARFRAGTLKSIATGETLTGERKYQEPFAFRPQAKLWIGGNHKPRLDGADFGLTRRLRLIPFLEKISPEEEIPREEFLAILRAEASGILNWMLRGLKTWRPGLRHAPEKVREASAEYAKSEDELGDFIEQCTQDADEMYRETTRKVAYDAYSRWAELQGNKYPLGLKAFTRRLGDKGWTLDPGRRYWRGKSIRYEEDWGEAQV